MQNIDNFHVFKINMRIYYTAISSRNFIIDNKYTSSDLGLFYTNGSISLVFK